MSLSCCQVLCVLGAPLLTSWFVTSPGALRSGCWNSLEGEHPCRAVPHPSQLGEDCLGHRPFVSAVRWVSVSRKHPQHKPVVSLMKQDQERSGCLAGGPRAKVDLKTSGKVQLSLEQAHKNLSCKNVSQLFQLSDAFSFSHSLQMCHAFTTSTLRGTSLWKTQTYRLHPSLNGKGVK